MDSTVAGRHSERPLEGVRRHWIFQSAFRTNLRRVSEGIFRCGWPEAATAVPAAPPARTPIAAPVPPPAIPPMSAPSPAPPTTFPAVFFPSPFVFVSLTLVTTG